VRIFRTSVAVCMLLCGGWEGVHAASLEDCRVARHDAPAAALLICTEALQSASGVDDAFEARMHLVELRTARGDLDAAAAELAAAERALPMVIDPLAQHRVARRQGMLAYRRRDMARALSYFLQALAAARTRNDQRAIAVSENDLGVVYRHLGEDQQALAYWLSSLEHKRLGGESDLAATEDNIGNLYRDLKEPELARSYLEQALAGHRSEGRVLLAAHTIEDLGSLAGDADNFVLAREHMQSAWTTFTQEQARVDQLRVSRHRADLEWRAGDTDAAQLWSERARQLAQELKQPTPIDMLLLQARMQAKAGDSAAAYALLAEHPMPAADENPELAKAWAEALSQWAQQLGHYRAALGHAEDAHRIELEMMQRRHGERMDALRVRFEFSELEHERDQLQRANAEQALALQQRRNQLLALGLACVLVVSGLLVFYQRRLYRQRLHSQKMQAEQRVQVEEARRVAESLRADLRSLRVALDQSSEPIVVIDAAGVIQLANGAAAKLLQRGEETLRGARLAEVFGAEVAAQLQLELERLSSGEPAVAIQVPTGTGSAVSIRALSLKLEEELGVLSLSNEAQAGNWVDTMNRAHARWEQNIDIDAAAVNDESDATDAGRSAMVELMQVIVEAWERSTCSTRLELAEKSGIWRITIDDGRLRTRTLNRYLELATLPARPRWREVLRTAYFVLAECALESAQRELINTRIGVLQQQMRSASVGGARLGAVDRVAG
jgi:two-component system, sensor histidine kinase ChiS